MESRTPSASTMDEQRPSWRLGSKIKALNLEPIEEDAIAKDLELMGSLSGNMERDGLRGFQEIQRMIPKWSSLERKQQLFWKPPQMKQRRYVLCA